ncbi:chemotaxis protein CheD [Acetobacterium bakii]|uniref:Protein-glutamine glutaminase n=1 Tax=Acetobacterium bakii TaxID=52689 RepID=A0A0L6TY74_9FIRM|nr:chemotaxis protein CheD [Acetobacterium bakii]KNZ41224.1 hypothetical protein AKG39_12945 [Acetobacterium bakii]
MDTIIGIGELGIIKNPGDRLITYALASCVAVTFYCQEPKVAGMIHVALPRKPDHIKDLRRPGYYAATGLPILMKALVSEYGCDLSRTRIHMIGGASSVRGRDVFNIGQRNTKQIKKILNSRGLGFNTDDLGGTLSRTVELELSKGEINICYHLMAV